MGEWLRRYGSGCGGSGALWVGDKFYGRLARLWGCVERLGWLPVVRVEPS
jgi:hypothetical protein